MFKNVISTLLAEIVIKLLSNYRLLSLQLLKIEVAKCYLHGVRLAQRSAFGLLKMVLEIGLIALGSLLVHVGLFILLPGSLETKALFGMVLGVVYMLIGALALRAGMKEKTWMEQSGALTMLNDAMGQPPKV